MYIKGKARKYCKPKLPILTVLSVNKDDHSPNE